MDDNEKKYDKRGKFRGHTEYTGYDGYGAFASRGYRLLSCTLIPGALLLLQRVLLTLGILRPSVEIPILLAGYFVLADAWVFGGSCARGGTWMEYLKSSARGSVLLRKALIRDCLVRFGVLALTTILAVAQEQYFPAARSDGYAMLAREPVLLTAQRILTAYAVSTLLILVERYLTQTIWYFNFASWGTFFHCIAVIPLSKIQDDIRILPPLLFLTAACCVLFSLLAVGNVMRKVRRSYYDQPSEI